MHWVQADAPPAWTSLPCSGRGAVLTLSHSLTVSVPRPGQPGRRRWAAGRSSLADLHPGPRPCNMPLVLPSSKGSPALPTPDTLCSESLTPQQTPVCSGWEPAMRSQPLAQTDGAAGPPCSPQRDKDSCIWSNLEGACALLWVCRGPQGSSGVLFSALCPAGRLRGASSCLAQPCSAALPPGRGCPPLPPEAPSQGSVPGPQPHKGPLSGLQTRGLVW